MITENITYEPTLKNFSASTSLDRDYSLRPVTELGCLTEIYGSFQQYHEGVLVL